MLPKVTEQSKEIVIFCIFSIFAFKEALKLSKKNLEKNIQFLPFCGPQLLLESNEDHI